TGRGGATVRYTTDGSDPTEGSTTYTAAVVVDHSLVLKAKAWKAGYTASGVSTATYTLKVITPTMTPGSATYSSPQTVTISTSTAGAELHYTTNGADPTQADPSIASGASITIDMPLTLKVRGWRSGWTASDVAAAAYSFQVATPTLVPGTGNYSGGLPVTVSTTTPGAVLPYRMDGAERTETDPTIASGSAVTVDRSATLKVIGWRTGWSASATASGTYFIDLGPVAQPVMTPDPGAYSAAQLVTITT